MLRNISLLLVCLCAVILCEEPDNSLEITSRISALNVSRTAPRRSRHKHVVPQFMLDLFERTSRGRASRGDQLVAEVVRSLTPRTSESLAWPLGTAKRHLLVFDVPAWNPGERLLAAELRFWASKPQSEEVDRELWVRIWRQTPAGKLSSLDSKHLFLHHAQWLSLNVTKAVRGGARPVQLRLVLQLKGTLASHLPLSQPLLLLYHQPQESPSLLPLPPVNIRRKRNAELEDYEEETNNVWDEDTNRARMSSASARRNRRLRNSCRRRPLYVDFAEINYDSWIVAPDGYEAFQCAGKCFFPVSDHLSPTKHAIVQTLVHSMVPAKAPRACCVPTRLEPISVLYLDENGVLTYRFSYRDMVVAECGCR
ncbi:bone morphogenetic protein 10 [Anabrus simplex]|uniref:bone morphogenetic protein 10 n=1 Tax=Anabrus simplex TaxID=316456 RepID=UPI0035A3CC38